MVLSFTHAHTRTYIIGASLSKPNVYGTNEREIYIYIIGASLSEPHIDDMCVREIYYYYYYYYYYYGGICVV